MWLITKYGGFEVVGNVEYGGNLASIRSPRKTYLRRLIKRFPDELQGTKSVVIQGDRRNGYFIAVPENRTWVIGGVLLCEAASYSNFSGERLAAELLRFNERKKG